MTNWVSFHSVSLPSNTAKKHSASHSQQLIVRCGFSSFSCSRSRCSKSGGIWIRYTEVWREREEDRNLPRRNPPSRPQWELGEEEPTAIGCFGHKEGGVFGKLRNANTSFQPPGVSPALPVVLPCVQGWPFQFEYPSKSPKNPRGQGI